ncbi:MAG TPA: GGDEF domain-containing protein [Rubrivivax sp.]|nr:GGDEF domain-containing protein [Rubrivivax sp.]HRY88105.1 GGDEF domain-containing protein [Rubrivivax sp.]HRZ62252.1 GGDEF domain-containing protein [Rubrivivax sp.]
MDMAQGAAQLAAAASPVQLAKAALRRMALDKVEPTPENYARAYAAEGGPAAAAAPPPAPRALLQRIAAQLDDSGGDALAQALTGARWDAAAAALDRLAAGSAAQAQDWALVIERLAHGLDRGSRSWTPARKRDSLLRVLGGSRGDERRLRLRIDHLLHAWAGEGADAPVETAGPAPQALAKPGDAPPAAADGAVQPAAAGAVDWLALVAHLEGALRAALPGGEPRAQELAAALERLAGEVAAAGATPALVGEADALCLRARRLLAHRQHLLDELGKLCIELTRGLTELAEDDSWARGQCEAVQARLTEGLNVRSVRAAADLLANARKRQAALRGERNQARDALKELIQGMLGEIGSFAEHTGRFHDNVGRHAEAIAKADSLDSLAGVVHQMLHDSSEVQVLVQQTQGRLRAEQERAGAAQLRVRELEGELRRLSDEACTDALTQVANRRGLAQAFGAERARMQRAGAGAGLAVGLIDIDNFKKLNDSLGHAAGDVALQRLAAEVRARLRPQDTVARFGGEEFVVLLPDTAAADAQRVLTRLQRELTASLFMHDRQEVFVTFSAGVTALRGDEPLETALERADEALYEAKRNGKNRTCAV